ncbi:MAG: hypothetical protein QF898_19045 [SAR202 cluster bacterium]|jgi:hypothetical protein|nr:hypothetical protein [SAR202 cluster bacterium]MDP6513564.1 hypothetical protein [SAR202 cluster bacterium]MDP6713734.1 hypothetical protein [SAR202 cluster bacterium]
MSTSKKAISVLLNLDEYEMLVRKSAELTLAEGYRVSVAELVRRATLAAYVEQTNSIENARGPTSEG